MLRMLDHGFPRDAMVAESSKLFPVPIRIPLMLTYLAFLLAFFLQSREHGVFYSGSLDNYQYIISLLSRDTSNPML